MQFTKSIALALRRGKREENSDVKAFRVQRYVSVKYFGSWEINCGSQLGFGGNELKEGTERTKLEAGTKEQNWRKQSKAKYRRKGGGKRVNKEVMFC